MTYANFGNRQIFGRDGEIATLREAYNRVITTGYGEITLVGGPAGSGKTSVVNAFLATTHNLNFVHAKADEAYRWVPYAAILKALSFFLPKDAIDEIIAIQDASTPISPSRVRERIIDSVRAHTSPTSPLIIFIDDLQWLDDSSVQLLCALSERGMRDMLLIGTYRNGGVSEFESKGLSILLGDPSVRITNIALDTLGYDAVEGLISSQRFGETTKPLARLVQSVAGGNPFHIQLILGILGQADAKPDLAQFISDQKNWGLDSLLGKLIGSLPDETKLLMHIASCVGFSSEITLLSSVSGVPRTRCDDLLKAASSLGLLRYDENVCQFTHDHVREHVRKGLAKNVRTRIHASVAVGMLATSSRTPDQRLAVAEQILKAKRSPVLFDHLNDVVDALMTAAVIARSVGSFEGALRYVEGGTEFLSLSSMLSSYDRKLAELRCSVLIDIKGASIEDAELEGLLLGARTPLDTARAVRLQAAVLILRGQFEDAMNASLAGLRCLGIKLSRTPSDDEIESAYRTTMVALESFSLENLSGQPRANDEAIIAAMDLLATLQSSFFSDDGLKFVHTAKIVELSIVHGVAGATCYGLSWFGVCLASYYGEYARALEMAEAAVQLSGQEAFRLYRTSSLVALDQVSVWLRPLSYGLSKAREAFEQGKSNGDISMACYATNHVVSNLLAMGAPLSIVKNEAARGMALARSVGFNEVIQILQLQDAYATALKSGIVPDINPFEAVTVDTSSQMSPLVFWAKLFEGIAAFYRGDLKSASHSLKKAELWKWTTPAHIHVAELHFYASLLERMGGTVRADDEHGNAIATYAAQNEATFGNKLALLEAEEARASGDTIGALRLYEASIKLARDAELSHELALAHERTGRLCVEVGLFFAGVEHLRQARVYYRRWGADYLADRLETEFGELLSREVARHVSDDLMPKAGKVDALTTDLVIAAIKYSGAMRGQLISVDGSELKVIANSLVQNGQTTAATEESLYTSAMAPASMIRLVVESAQSLRYGHALTEAGELHGQSLKDCPARSVLCVPLKLDDQVSSILYLENNAVSDAFSYETEQAIELFVVATTAAMRLKRQIDSDSANNSDRGTRDNLVNIRADMIKNSHVTVLGGMAASIVHEVNQPLSAIVTHASAGTRWLKQAVPQIEKAINNFTKIEESGVRASGIISALRSLAKQAPANLEFLDLKSVVSDVLGFLETDARTAGANIECALADGGKIFADPIQVQQVVLNLVTNALDAMEGASVKALSVRLETRENVVVLAVKDSGGGIPVEVRNSIFEPFFTTKEQGLGMGLAICKTIAEVHGGTLAIGSSNATGTTMVFTLPITAE